MLSGQIALARECMCELVVEGTYRSEPYKARIEIAQQKWHRSTTQSFIEIDLVVRAVLITDGRMDGQAIRDQQVTPGTHSPDLVSEIKCTASQHVNA